MATSPKPILRDELSITKRIQLASLMLHPGWEVVLELARAGCNDETAKVIQLPVETPNYRDVLTAYQQLAQAAWRFSNRLFDSIEWHARQADAEQAAENLRKSLGLEAKAEPEPGINPIPNPIRRQSNDVK